MAQRVEIVLEDDLDGSEATETVVFALDGTSYEIDLNEKHAAALRDALSVYVGHARRVSPGRRARARTGSSSRARSGPGEIRAWARENGYEVSERGRVPRNVVEAFEAR